MVVWGYNLVFCKVNDEFVWIDFNNIIIDLYIDLIMDFYVLVEDLIYMVGVVEYGLFLDMVNIVIVGYVNGFEVIEV